MTVTAMPPKDETEAKPKRNSKKLVAFVAILAVAAAAGWFLVLKPKEGGPKAPKPGEVVKLDSLQINLTDGHYLRAGIALQLTTAAKAEELDGSKALDAEIDTFSGLTMASVMAKGAREKLKEQLMVELKERYEGEVMDIYYTEFVTQ